MWSRFAGRVWERIASGAEVASGRQYSEQRVTPSYIKAGLTSRPNTLPVTLVLNTFPPPYTFSLDPSAGSINRTLHLIGTFWFSVSGFEETWDSSQENLFADKGQFSQLKVLVPLLTRVGLAWRDTINTCSDSRTHGQLIVLQFT